MEQYLHNRCKLNKLKAARFSTDLMVIFLFSEVFLGLCHRHNLFLMSCSCVQLLRLHVQHNVGLNTCNKCVSGHLRQQKQAKATLINYLRSLFYVDMIFTGRKQLKSNISIHMKSQWKSSVCALFGSSPASEKDICLFIIYMLQYVH